MGIISNFLKSLTDRKSIPLSNTYSRYYSPVITHSDSLDFYTSWVWACIDKRAKVFASTEFSLYRLNSKGEIEEVMQHELLDLMMKLNEEMTKFDFFELSSTYLDLFGASPMYLDYQGKSKPQAIYLIRPEYLKSNRNQDGSINSYTYQIGGFKKDLLKEEVIMLKNYNPRNPDQGLGTIEAVRQSAEQDDYMLQNNSNLLKNESKPSGVLELPASNLNADTLKRLKKEWNDKYGGFENAGKVQILTDGMKFTPLGLSPKDLDYIESQKFTKDKILSIFGVPPELLGNLQNANRASAEAVMYVFSKFTIEPLVKKYVAQLNEFLVPIFGDDLYLDFEPIAQEDETTLVNKVNLLTDKVLTKNESRDLLGYDPVEGGDVIYQNIAQVPLGMDLSEDPTATKGFIKEYRGHKQGVDRQKARMIKRAILNRNLKMQRLFQKMSDHIMNGLKSNSGKKTTFRIIKEKKETPKKIKLSVKKDQGVILKLSKKGINAKTRALFLQETLKEETRLTTKWTRELKRYFASQKMDLIAYVEDKYNLKSFNIKKYKGFDKKSTIDTLIAIIEPTYYESVMSGIKSTEKYFAPKGYNDTKHDYSMVKLWATRTATKVATDITNTTIDQLTNTILDAVSTGLAIQEVKEGIQKVFDTMTDTRAEMIARTETSRAYSEAHYRAYEEMGYKDVVWLVADACCDECEEKSKMSWTTDSIRDEQPVHPNCRCDFAPLG